MAKRQLDWTNISVLASAHLLAGAAIFYLAAVRFSWMTVGFAILWLACCSVSITGGYHRLFAHPTYKANPLIRAFYLVFGAASVQNSALKWSWDHRVHHARTDRTEDPYNIRRGFWWAHIGWVLHRDDEDVDLKTVADLDADPLVRLQHRFYVPLAVVVGALLPMLIGTAWGDPLGALLVAGFLRLVIQWHATFSVNSFAHYLGHRPYTTRNSARDSFWTALLTLGEGYHNFHHRFQADYRNGVRWFHFDPTKWFVYSLSKVGLARDLRRASNESIRRARQAVLEGEAASSRVA